MTSGEMVKSCASCIYRRPAMDDMYQDFGICMNRHLVPRRSMRAIRKAIGDSDRSAILVADMHKTNTFLVGNDFCCCHYERKIYAEVYIGTPDPSIFWLPGITKEAAVST